MKRVLFASIVACSVLLCSASVAMAVPPNPIREAAQYDQTCAIRNGVSGRFSHGAWVSGVALGIYSYPVDPVFPCGLVTEE
ncbi:MAG: hypothetical protein AB7V46_11410 [Thermomicrobiales bacterium]